MPLETQISLRPCKIIRILRVVSLWYFLFSALLSNTFKQPLHQQLCPNVCVVRA